MKNANKATARSIRRVRPSARVLTVDQRGITGLETAIVLIAFVVVASVFAFAVLSSGILTSEKTKTTVTGGLQQGGVAVAIKGSVIAHESTTADTVGTLQIPVVAATDDSVDLSATSLVVTYIDADQVVDLSQNLALPLAAQAGGDEGWNTAFRAGDSGPVLDPGERADIWISVNGLTTALQASTAFTIQIKPSIGATLEVSRTTPGEIKAITNLR